MSHRHHNTDGTDGHLRRILKAASPCDHLITWMFLNHLETHQEENNTLTSADQITLDLLADLVEVHNTTPRWKRLECVWLSVSRSCDLSFMKLCQQSGSKIKQTAGRRPQIDANESICRASRVLRRTTAISPHFMDGSAIRCREKNRKRAYQEIFLPHKSIKSAWCCCECLPPHAPQPIWD